MWDGAAAEKMERNGEEDERGGKGNKRQEVKLGGHWDRCLSSGQVGDRGAGACRMLRLGE